MPHHTLTQALVDCALGDADAVTREQDGRDLRGVRADLRPLCALLPSEVRRRVKSAGGV